MNKLNCISFKDDSFGQTMIRLINLTLQAVRHFRFLDRPLTEAKLLEGSQVRTDEIGAKRYRTDKGKITTQKNVLSAELLPSWLHVIGKCHFRYGALATLCMPDDLTGQNIEHKVKTLFRGVNVIRRIFFSSVLCIV